MMLFRSITVLLVAAGILAAQGPLRDRRGPRRPPPHSGPAAIERLNSMTPGQRARVLERLPPDRRREIENRVDQYNKLSPEEKQQLSDRYDRFQRLPPDRRDEARRVFSRFRNLPEERRSLVRNEIEAQRQMTPEARQDHLDSSAYLEKYSPEERRIIRDLSEAFSPSSDPLPEEL
jgi:hypothetical protein